MSGNIEILIAKGVHIPRPFSVEIGKEIDPDRISGDNVFIYRGSKIYGEKTELTIRALGRLTTEKDFRDLIIREDNAKNSF